MAIMDASKIKYHLQVVEIAPKNLSKPNTQGNQGQDEQKKQNEELNLK